MGLNPSTSGDLIRLPCPSLTEETRQEYIKQARTEAENLVVSIRNTRRDANNSSQRSAKSWRYSLKMISKEIEDLVQKETDHFIRSC